MKSKSDRCSICAANDAISALPSSSSSPNAYWSSMRENKDRASDSGIHPRSPTGKARSDADSAALVPALSLDASGGHASSGAEQGFDRLPHVHTSAELDALGKCALACRRKNCLLSTGGTRHGRRAEQKRARTEQCDAEQTSYHRGSAWEHSRSCCCRATASHKRIPTGRSTISCQARRAARRTSSGASWRRLSPKSSGQPVVVLNRAGAGGTIAAAAVAKVAPDGYTILQANANHSFSQTFYKNLSYDLEKDFSPVGRFASAFYIVLAHPKVGVRTLKELIEKAKVGARKVELCVGRCRGRDVHRHRGAESTSRHRHRSYAVQRRRTCARLDPRGCHGRLRIALHHRQALRR